MSSTQGNLSKAWLRNFLLHSAWCLAVGAASIYLTYFGPGRNGIWEWNYGWIPQNESHTRFLYHGGYLEIGRIVTCLVLQFSLLLIFPEARIFFARRRFIPVMFFANCVDNWRRHEKKLFTLFSARIFIPLSFAGVAVYILAVAPKMILVEFTNRIGDAQAFALGDAIRSYVFYLPYSIVNYCYLIGPNFLMLLYCLDASIISFDKLGEGVDQEAISVSTATKDKPDQIVARLAGLRRGLTTSVGRFAQFGVLNVGMLFVESSSTMILTLGSTSQEVLKSAALITIAGVPLYFALLFTRYRKHYLGVRHALGPDGKGETRMTEGAVDDLLEDYAPKAVFSAALRIGSYKSLLGSVVFYFLTDYVSAENMTVRDVFTRATPSFIHRPILAIGDVLYPSRPQGGDGESGVKHAHEDGNLKRLSNPYPFTRLEVQVTSNAAPDKESRRITIKFQAAKRIPVSGAQAELYSLTSTSPVAVATAKVESNELYVITFDGQTDIRRHCKLVFNRKDNVWAGGDLTVEVALPATTVPVDVRRRAYIVFFVSIFAIAGIAGIVAHRRAK